MAAAEQARGGELALALHVEGDPAPLGVDEVERLVARALAAFALDAGAVDAGVQFVDEARMRELNAAHRDEDAATDVLSFPIDGCEQLPAGVPRQLGDVVVCTAYVQAQLREGTAMAGGDTTLHEALRRCVVHGVLHLLGELHDDDAGASRMFGLEATLLGATA